MYSYKTKGTCSTEITFSIENDIIYIGDYMGGKLRIIDFSEQKVKTIPIGNEPNGMILIN